jgi:hypothetical protein
LAAIAVEAQGDNNRFSKIKLSRFAVLWWPVALVKVARIPN